MYECGGGGGDGSLLPLMSLTATLSIDTPPSVWKLSHEMRRVGTSNKASDITIFDDSCSPVVTVMYCYCCCCFYCCYCGVYSVLKTAFARGNHI